MHPRGPDGEPVAGFAPDRAPASVHVADVQQSRIRRRSRKRIVHDIAHPEHLVHQHVETLRGVHVRPYTPRAAHRDRLGRPVGEPSKPRGSPSLAEQGAYALAVVCQRQQGIRGGGSRARVGGARRRDERVQRSRVRGDVRLGLAVEAQVAQE